MMNTQRKTFINEMNARDVRKLSQPIEGYYDPEQHPINAKHFLDNVWMWFCIIAMLILSVAL
jgi:hypothetical protein